MRVVLLCSDPGVPLGGDKGCSVHLRAVAGALRRAGHEVQALVANAGSERGLEPLRESKVSWHVVPGEAASAELRDRLGRGRPDLVIERLALLAPHGAQAAAEADVPHLYEVNAPLDVEAAAHRGFARGVEARAVFAESFSRSRGAVAVSDEVAGWVRSLAPPDFTVEVVPNGADPAFLEDPPAQRVAALARRLHLAKGEFVVGFAGTFRPWHDLATLVSAVGQLARRRGARLLLVGDGPTRNDVLREAARLGTPITMAGAVPHAVIPDYLALCDAVAVPYADAGVYFSPLKLVEAMAAARPVVASATRPVARLIRDGHDGLLVPPGDPAAMAAALEQLAADPGLARRLGVTARATVARSHTWDAAVASVLALAARVGAPEAPPCPE